MATLAEIQNRKVPLKGNKRTQTKRVRIKGPHGGLAIINIKDFHPEIHEEIDEEAAAAAEVEGLAGVDLENAKAAAAQQRVKEANKVTPLTRLELGEMSQEALKMTPEWGRIAAGKRSKLRDKDAMVDAIIGARRVAGR